MRPEPPPPASAHASVDQILEVRLLTRSRTTPAAQPPAPPAPPKLTPPPAHQAAQRMPHHEAVITQDRETAPANTPAATGVFAKDGSVHLPPATANAWAGTSTKSKPAKPADDRRIMQHADYGKRYYKPTRFEKYFPPSNETAGGALGRHIGNGLKAIAKSLCNPNKSNMATSMLCAVPPLPPSPKDRDERLNLPSAPLAGNPHPAKPWPLSACIAQYHAGKPLPYGCPPNTPELAFKAIMRTCIDLFRAGKRLKTWCPADTPKRAAAEKGKD